LEKAPWLSLLRSRAGEGLLEAFARRTAVALAVATMLTTIAIAEAAAVTIAKAETAIVALAVAVDLAHHRGGTFLVLVHANREVAQHILAEPLLPLDLAEGGRY
jgi:putative ubiquitin-RnfH superfamily antitoxin RatB of RatAB toxin-antitoxin module